MAIKKTVIIQADTTQAVKSVDELNETVEQTTDSTEELNEVNQETFGALDSMTGGAVGGFKKLTAGVKTGVVAMKSLRGAIIATGVGALLVAITSLSAWFKRTEEGAQALRVVMAGLGAAVDVIS